MLIPAGPLAKDMGMDEEAAALSSPTDPPGMQLRVSPGGHKAAATTGLSLEPCRWSSTTRDRQNQQRQGHC